MKRSTEIVGQPVISITEGKEFGHVKELLVNYVNGSIAALVIDDGKWYLGAKLLPFEAIAGLGEYAVTIDNSADILTVKDKPELEKLLEAGIKIIGTKVLTKGGRMQGRINEIVIDDTGKINTCELETVDGAVVSFPAQRVVTFGKEVVIIAGTDEVAIAKPPAAPPVTKVPAVPPEPVPAVRPEVIPVPGQQAEVLAAAGVVEETKGKEQAADDSAKKFDDKHRKFLLGKKAARRIETDNGMIIVDQGGEITEEVLQKAKLANKFVELSMNIQ
ncbi:PRC-barrel domain-containing protein [Sporomusa termitida]|uniref:PRC-barrel domain protein n=1 Tax=Sporomusa termitida TaxID=2377 RepID=A0A517DTI0_9FIRM|nr:PRC-barrel domain-containing protein [Sporomusa termitida]QDR80618.1 PRC-barrel domain protein [Sporomusa termitida]